MRQELGYAIFALLGLALVVAAVIAARRAKRRESKSLKVDLFRKRDD